MSNSLVVVVIPLNETAMTRRCWTGMSDLVRCGRVFACAIARADGCFVLFSSRVFLALWKLIL